MSSLKNFFTIFIVCLVVTVSAKFIFAFYIFTEIASSQKIYAVFYGYKFDLAMSAIVAFLATLFDFHKKTMTIVAVILIIVVFGLQIADTMYFYDSSRHISYELKDAMKDASGLFMVAVNQHRWLLIGSILAVGLIFVGTSKLFKHILSREEINKIYPLNKFLLLLISVFFIRGMWQPITLNPWQSNKVANSHFSSIALNAAYNMLYTNLRQKGHLQRNHSYVTVDETDSVKSLYGDRKAYKEMLESTPNVVMFFLESWSGTFIHSYGGSYQTTPNFDHLLKQSIRPKAMIANGHRTTEGIFATLTSFQNPLGKTVAKTQLQFYEYRTLIDALNSRQHYSSAFFQGTDKESAATGSLAQSLGFEKSYGKHDVKKKEFEANHWGIHDRDLYNFALEQLENMPQPFIIGINGATTHDIVLPKAVEKIHFVDDDVLNMKFNTFYYSDQWMYEFVKKVEEKYPNTIFVFLADHCGSGITSNFLNYMIPFAIYSKKLPAMEINQYMSQRDIAPTLTDLIAGDYRKIAPAFTGKSILREEDLFADYYHNGVLGVVKNQVAIEVMPDKILCYDVSEFKDKPIQCPEDAQKIANQIKSFTNVSQDLLFKGETAKFREYRQ